MTLIQQTSVNPQNLINKQLFNNFIQRKQIFSSSKKTLNSKKKDPLHKYPLRGLAYCNEIGTALLPIPTYGNLMFWLSWFPAMFYFGADIYDKYKQGINNDYKDPSITTGIRQTVFQFIASVAAPTGAIAASHKITTEILIKRKDGADSYLDRIHNKIKVAKKEYYQKLNSAHPKDLITNLGKIIGHFKDNKITKHAATKEIKMVKDVADEIARTMGTEIATILQDKIDGKLDHKELKKFNEKLIRHKKNEKILYELSKILNNPVNKVTLKNKPNSIGIISDVTKIINKYKTLKEKLFDMFAEEILLKKPKHGIARVGKLNLLKMLTVPVGFITLAIVAIPIDILTEKLIIKKVFDPALMAKKS